MCLAFFVNDSVVGAVCHAVGSAAAVLGAELALLNGMAVIAGHNCAEGADQNAGKAADAFIGVDLNKAVIYAESACYAAFYTERVVAVAAIYRKADVLALFDLYAGIYGPVLQGENHIALAAVGEGAVIFTEVAAEAPLFIYIYLFQDSSFLSEIGNYNLGPKAR